MIFENYTASQLNEFIRSDFFKYSSVIPISRHRAESHINNPYLEPDDVIMVMAYNDDKKLVGYVGVLPGKMNVEGRKQKIGWLSCLWIDTEERGKGIARKLVETAINLWDKRIVATEFTTEAKALYDKIGLFSDLQISQGLRGYLRYNLHKILPPKKPVYRNVKGVLKVGDFVLNLFNDRRIALWNRNFNLPVRTEICPTVDDELKVFIEQQNRTETFQRNASDLQWILDFPWIRSGGTADLESKKYHFSSWAEHFEYLPLKIFEGNNNLIGFILLSIRDQAMKTPYMYFQQGKTAEISEVILKLMIDKNINEVTTFHPELVAFWQKSNTPFIQQRKMKRHYIHTNLITKAAEQVFKIQDGDGDCAFT